MRGGGVRLKEKALKGEKEGGGLQEDIIGCQGIGVSKEIGRTEPRTEECIGAGRGGWRCIAQGWGCSPDIQG